MRLDTHQLAALLAVALLPAAGAALGGEGLWDAPAPAGLQISLSDGQAIGNSAGGYGGPGGAYGGMLHEAEGGSTTSSRDEDYYDWAGPPRSEPDWEGVKRDTLYFVGWQFAAIGILYVMPESVSGWTDEDKEEYNLDRWWDNVSNPVWDEDEWYVNYLLHPYWGAAYYVRARERGLGEGQALLYSTFNSALYEFGAEALFEPASYTDLVVTPLFGWLLGEYVFVPWRERARANPAGIGTAEKVLLTATDPLGVIYGATDHALGIRTDFALGPLPQLNSRVGAFGKERRNPWQDDLAPVTRSREIPWGVQWQVAW